MKSVNPVLQIFLKMASSSSAFSLPAERLGILTSKTKGDSLGNPTTAVALFRDELSGHENSEHFCAGEPGCPVVSWAPITLSSEELSSGGAQAQIWPLPGFVDKF